MIILPQIPAELRKLDRWTCWQEVSNEKPGGKPGKPPINANVVFCDCPVNHEYASVNEPLTWTTYEMAKEYWRTYLAKGSSPSGLSFMLNGDGIVGIDLDHCRDKVSKVIDNWATEIIERFASYTEISPSGTGCRIFLRGKLPPHGRHKGDIEVYDTNKALSVTGRKLTIHGVGNGIEDRTEELLAWHGEVFGDAHSSSTKKKEGAGGIVVNKAPTIDQGRLARLFEARPKAKTIFNGEWEGYPSQSEADLALASIAMWAGWPDQQVCDLLVEARNNVGEKTKHDGYFIMTIAKARAGLNGHATGRVLQDGKSTFRKSQGGSISPALATLKDLFKKHYYFSDEDVIDLVLGVVAGNHIDSDPIWLHLISAPSGGKTELLYSVFDCEETYFLSDFTAASLISGYKDPPKEGAKSKQGKVVEEALEEQEADEEATASAGEEVAEDGDAEPQEEADYSLLPKLNGKVVITKDFSIIHDKPSETRAQILSILRDVYDGYASRALGNSAPKGFHARFNYLTGMTPDIEKSWSLNTLGERFLMYRIQIADRREHARRALLNARDVDKGAMVIRKELQHAVKLFMDNVEHTKPKVSDQMVDKILDLADILSTCRTYVHRDRNDDMPCLPQAELAARVGKQLMRVGQSVASVRCKPEVTEDEFKIMKRIALDSLPTNRRLLITVLWEQRGSFQPLKTFADKVSRIAAATVRRELENLAELGAVNRQKSQVRVASEKTKKDGTSKEVKTTKECYQLAESFIKACNNIGGIPSS